MPDIFHDLSVAANPERVFAAISLPAGLDKWWTVRSSGEPNVGETYELWFGPEYDWRAVVMKSVRSTEFELRITEADKDWTGTLLGFRLEWDGTNTGVSFYHTGWPAQNAHYRRSSYCWAMYLRVLKRYLEQGEVTAYEARND